MDVLGPVRVHRFHQHRLAAGTRQRDASVPAPVVAALQLVRSADAELVREDVSPDHLVVPEARLLLSESSPVRLPEEARALTHDVELAGRGRRATGLVAP